MKLKTWFILTILLAVTGCTTKGTVIIPENSELYLYDRETPVVVGEQGQVETKPFFWTATAGVPYKLEQDGQVIREGKIKSKFRPVSIFWPPYALLYWPMGIDPNITHDLTKDTVE